MGRIRAFILVAMLAWLVLGILELTHSPIDLVQWVHTHSLPSLDVFFKYYTQIGEIPMIAGSLLVVFFVKREWFFYAVLAVIINTLIVQGLKFGLKEPRPFWELGDFFREIKGVRILKSLSFPSGHSAAAILSCGIVATLFNKPWLQVVLCCAALLIGYSRMYLGLHYSRDVFMGISIGLANLFLFLYLTKRADK